MRQLLGSATCVLFDFDGPVCDLFHGHPAPAIAERFRDATRSPGSRRLPSWFPVTDDPYRILGATAERQSGNGLLETLEAALTEEELRATPSAYPTPYADRLISALRATGRQLAITTNNSQSAVESYLETRNLRHHFAGHIHGRVPGKLRLKPDPHCLERALESTGCSAGQALMIGDAPRDYKAAEKIDVPFLGYARNLDKHEQLIAAGATHIVGSLAEVLRIVDPTARV